MKSIFTFLLLFSCLFLPAQSWMKMMNDPSVNYYDVEKLFFHWKDSLENNSNQNNLHALIHHKSTEEKREMIEEVDEQFYHWTNETKNDFDANGNRLSSDELKRLNDSYRFANSNSTQQMQGNWVLRGPTSFLASSAGQNPGIGMTTSIAIDQTDSNNVYLIGGGGCLWKSANDGNNWNLLMQSTPTFSFSYIKTDPLNGNVLYAVISGNFSKSIDAGITWTQLNVSFTNFSFKLLIDPTNNQNLFLSSPNYGIQKSTDGGSTWTTINPMAYGDLEVNPLNPNVLYGLGNNAVVRSNDGGITFTSSPAIPFTYPVRELSVTRADTNYIYVLSDDNNYHGQVAVSTNGGNTFSLQPITSNILDGVGYHFDVSPADKNLIIQAGIRCSRSTDGGLTWNWAASEYYNFTNPPYEHVDNRFIIFNGKSFWSCNDGGVYKSVDGGLTWTDKTHDMAITAFTSIASSETDSSVFVGSCADNSAIIHHSTGWSCMFAGDGYSAAIKPNDPMTVYAKSQYSYARSFDGLTTAGGFFFTGLTESIYSFDNSHPIQFNHQNSNSMYLLANNVWKSVDNGNHVTQISNFAANPGGGFLYVCSSDSNIIFTTYYHTLNNGVTWIANTKKVIGVDPDEPNKVWARNSANEAFGIFYSTDGGTTWISIPSLDLNLSPNAVINLRVANNIHNGVYLFSNYTIYYLDDRLNNWQPFNNGLPPAQIADMNVLTNFGKVRLATASRGIWESNLYDSTQALSVGFIADKYSICPNDTVHFYDNSLNNGPGFNPVYHWYFPGGNPFSSTSSNPLVIYSSTGTYNVTLVVSNTNGTDSLTQNIFINVNTPPVFTVPLVEGFESTIFPPAGWNVNHYEPAIPLWNQSPTYLNTYGGYGHSSKSLKYYSTDTTNTDYFTTPNFNFSSVLDPILFFDYCYPIDTLYPDTLKIFYSTNCGFTRNYIYAKGGQNLRTALQYWYSFTPDSTTWKSDTIHLNTIQNLGDMQLGFEMKGNNMCTIYLDNINIASGPGNPLSISTTSTKNSLLFFPNPANDELNVNYFLAAGISDPVIAIYDAAGKLCFRQQLSPDQKTIKLNISKLPEGLFFCTIESGNTVLKSGKFSIVR